MEMYFCPLYSGSSGNALFCQYGETRLLIDAGKTGAVLEGAMARVGVPPETLSGILITHEHSDHIQAAGVMARSSSRSRAASSKFSSATAASIRVRSSSMRVCLACSSSLTGGRRPACWALPCTRVMRGVSSLRKAW